MIGVLNIDKPKGITSSDVVVRVRKILGTKAVGHFGTLDPMGEGVLPLGVGKATRLFDFMLRKDKVYEADFQFGYSTDTLDSQGSVLARSDLIPNFADIKSAAKKLIGRQNQLPPAYSAKSINGMRAYALARQGLQVDLAPAEVEIFSIDAVETPDAGKFSFTIHCSSGTYIRSVCRDLAQLLNSLATMTAIKRLQCGPFKRNDAISLEQLSEQKADALISLDVVLASLPRVDLEDGCYEYLLKGIKMESRDIPYEAYTVYCKNELFGIAKTSENGKITIQSYLRE